MQSRNLAARAGRWSAQHRKTAILGWILFVVLATVVGGKVGLNDIDESASGNGESKRGDMIVDAAGFPDQAGEQVLVQGKGSIKAGDPQVTAAVKDVVSRLGADRGHHRHREPARSRHARQHRLQGRPLGRRELQDAPARTSTSRSSSTSRSPPWPPCRRPTPACASSSSATPRPSKEVAAQDAKDGKKSEFISYGLMLIILLVAFGALVAAGLPLVLGATAVAATVGLLGPVSQLYALPLDVAQLVVIIGLAVGVDYAMFYSRRMMEERDRGHSAEAAVEIAAATSGRAVLISGLTVLTAMAGLLFAGNPIFIGFGIGTMLVVAVADARLDDLPARDALVPRREELAGEGPRALRHQAPPPGQGRVARLGRHPHPRPQAPAGVGADRRRPARRALHPRARHPVQGAGLRRLLAQPAGHPDLRPRPGRLPRRRRPGHDRDQGRRRHRRAGPGRDRAAARPGAGHRPALRALRASRSAPTRPSRSSPSRSRAAAPTPPPSARSRSCAPRSSRPPSAGWPAPRSP